MEFDVKITQVLEGHVKIEAENIAEALNIANQQYNLEGKELPDMDDVSALKFSIASVPEQTIPQDERGEHPTREQIEKYLTSQGYPNPGEIAIDEFLQGGEKQAMYDEAVFEHYFLGDVDRWFHLADVLEQPISFRAAMLIDSSLYEEDLEVLEVNTVKDICDTPENTFVNRLTGLAQQLCGGKSTENEWNVSDQDIKTLSQKFASYLPEKLVKQLSDIPENKKSSLISLIESADAKLTSAKTPERTPAIKQDR